MNTGAATGPDCCPRQSLDDIRQIPEPQFRQQLLDWMQSAEVSKKMQAKMRADLFASFNATTLGRQMSVHGRRAQPGSAAGGSLMLFASSPLLLALNTLAAEFLYTQNCQFTLSVLATETPHPNTMPDFAGAATPFRFSRRQAQQLLLTMGAPTAQADRVSLAYASGMERSNDEDEDVVNNSLLFTLCEALLRKAPPREADEQRQQQHDTCTQTQPIAGRPCTKNRLHNTTNGLTTDDGASKKSLQRPLLSYIKLLADHVQQLSDTVDNFTPTAMLENDALDQHLHKLQHRLHRLGRTRPKMARNLKHLTKVITRFTSRLVHCLRGIQQNAIKAPRPEGDTPNATATSAEAAAVGYSTWVLQLKHSKHGKRFLEHLRAHHRNVWEREVERQRTDWELKFQQERRLLKLHYKQRLLERYRDLLANSAGAGSAGTDRSSAAAAVVVEKDVPGKSDASVMTDAVRKMERVEVLSRLGGKPKTTQLDLSSRKLPDINITPEILHDSVHHRHQHPEMFLTEDSTADQIRTRIEALEAASEAIEASVQQRLDRHAAERRKIAEQQREIVRQSFVGKQLIRGVLAKAHTTTMRRASRTEGIARDASEEDDDDDEDNKDEKG